MGNASSSSKKPKSDKESRSDKVQKSRKESMTPDEFMRGEDEVHRFMMHRAEELGADHPEVLTIKNNLVARQVGLHQCVKHAACSFCLITFLLGMEMDDRQTEQLTSCRKRFFILVILACSQHHG